MMGANVKTTTGEPMRLMAQIALTEKRILDHQLRIRHYAASSEQTLRRRMTSPRTLLWASGAGLLIYMLIRRHPSVTHQRVGAGPRHGRLLGRVLSSVALIRTLFPTPR
jgi:hypothetical protein